MNLSCFSLFFHQTVPLFKLILYFLLFYFYGTIKVLILSYFAYKIYTFIMWKLYRLEPFSAGDRLFVWNKFEESYNLLGLFVCDNLDIEGLKKVFIERGIKKFSKMRSMQKYQFFDWWWKELDINEVLEKYNPIEVYEDTQLNFKTKDDIVSYVNKELLKKFDLERHLPYKICLMKNHPDSLIKNMIMIKFDHSLTDGLGFIGMITALSDNYDIKLFPASITKNPLTLKTILWSLLISPWLMVYPAWRHKAYLLSGETPFKSNKENLGIPRTTLSELYDFDLYSKIGKQLGITFNDLMMTVFSAALKKYCTNHFHRIPKMVATMTPIGNRSIPKNIEDIEITNNSSGIGCELILIDDPIKESHIISKEFSYHARNIPLAKSVKIMMDFMYLYLPFYLSKYLVKDTGKNFDFTISNVPGPRNNLYYSGCKIIDMIPFITPGVTSSFIGIITYSGKFRFSICFDSVLGTDPELVLKYVAEEFLLLKNSFKFNDVNTSNHEVEKQKNIQLLSREKKKMI